MGFFDLNIPYYESDRNVANKQALKTARLKLTIKALELGYTGIAYNRTFRGVMSESDRCSIPLFPISSVLKIAPGISNAVEFHRNLLGIPVSSPFRQYTRLTVIVESAAQASALNSGNPILKSYDVVAVRPLNQNAFEQACQVSEVDIIAIDFSEKLPFRLKQSMVKAAIQRGVYFEITYSSLILDVQMRMQMISNAKLLVDWTRGNNLILSSAAPSVTELRGPYDVSNLASLLGLKLERAKAALSKNCRTVITNALRKKCYHKEAIKVELVTSGAKEPEFDDWLKWDPISSNEGDLQLDDMKKAFSASSNVSENVKHIEFSSVLNNLPSHGLQIKDILCSTVPGQELVHTTNNSNNIPSKIPQVGSGKGGMYADLTPASKGSGQELVDTIADNLEEEKKNDRIVDEDMECTDSLDLKDTSGTKMHDLQSAGTYSASSEGYAVLPDSMTIQPCKRNIKAIAPLSDTHNLEKGKENDRTDIEDMKCTESLGIKDTSGTKMHDLLSTGTCLASSEGYVVLPDTDSATIHPCRREIGEATGPLNNTDNFENVKENDSSDNEDMKCTQSLDIKDTKMQDLQRTGVCSANSEGYAILPESAKFWPCRRDIELKENYSIDNDDELQTANNLDVQLNDIPIEKEQFRETGNQSANLADESNNNELSDTMEAENECLVLEKLRVEDVSEEELNHIGNNIETSYQILGGSLSGNMRRRSYRPSLFPFKRLLSRKPFKSKAQRLSRFVRFV